EILAGYHASTPTPTGPPVAGDPETAPAWVRGNLATARAHAALLRPELRGAFAAEDPWRRLLAALDVEGQLRGRSRIDQELYAWPRTVRPTAILTVGGDRAEMARAVEGRPPFLDHPLFAVTRPMPPAVKLRKPVKSVLREAARELLTDDVYAGRKKP